MITLKLNKLWLDKDNRPKCKYTPVTVDDRQTAECLKSVVKKRVETCQALAVAKPDSINESSWFGFVRDQLRERNLRSHHVPIIVLSGGKSARLKEALKKNLQLAWHPMTARGEPVYLFVHISDYRTYVKTLSEELGTYKNLFVVGWDGRQLTGFGAARCAALAFADSLAYRPQKILMMDQDVVSTEETRHTNPVVERQVNAMHAPPGKPERPVIGYGVGFPTRAKNLPSIWNEKSALPPKPKEKTAPTKSLISPTQQFVSIKAPFRKKNDGVYPAYMVAGGEDMLMSEKIGAFEKIVLPKKPNPASAEASARVKNQKITVNRDIRAPAIVKMDLGSVGDSVNNYWNIHRKQTLAALYEKEKTTRVSVDGQAPTTLEAFCQMLVTQNHIAEEAQHETCTLIIERIILKANKIPDAWPVELDNTFLKNV